MTNTEELLRSAAAAQTAQKLAAEASDIRSRPRFEETKKAADALAAAVKANIEACYASTRAQCHRDLCEQPPWSEEALRRDADVLVCRANCTVTHVAIVDALKAYENAVQMDALTDSLQETVKLVDTVSEQADSLFKKVEQRLGVKGAFVEAPLPDEPPVEIDG